MHHGKAFCTSAVSRNGLNPRWDKEVAEVVASHPELTQIVLSVCYKPSPTAKAKTLGYAALPLSAVRSGVRCVPLCDERGARLLFCKLLVRATTDSCDTEATMARYHTTIQRDQQPLVRLPRDVREPFVREPPPTFWGFRRRRTGRSEGAPANPPRTRRRRAHRPAASSSRYPRLRFRALQATPPAPRSSPPTAPAAHPPPPSPPFAVSQLQGSHMLNIGRIRHTTLFAATRRRFYDAAPPPSAAALAAASGGAAPKLDARGSCVPLECLGMPALTSSTVVPDRMPATAPPPPADDDLLGRCRCRRRRPARRRPPRRAAARRSAAARAAGAADAAAAAAGSYRDSIREEAEAPPAAPGAPARARDARVGAGGGAAARDRVDVFGHHDAAPALDGLVGRRAAAAAARRGARLDDGFAWRAAAAAAGREGGR